MILTFTLLVLCLSQSGSGSGLEDITSATVPLEHDVDSVVVIALTTGLEQISGNYINSGTTQNNFPIYLMPNDFRNRMVADPTPGVANSRNIVFYFSGSEVGYWNPTPLADPNITDFPDQGFNQIIQVLNVTTNEQLGKVRVFRRSAATSVPANIAPTTVAPTTTLSCPTRENVFPVLKTIKIDRRVKTAASCKDKCIELNGCQYWAWRNNSKNKYKNKKGRASAGQGTCMLLAVDWREMKNYVAGGIC